MDLGDFDGDGQTDLVVTAIAANVSASYGGAAYVVTGPITVSIDL
jgi:hypothetical protein